MIVPALTRAEGAAVLDARAENRTYEARTYEIGYGSREPTQSELNRAFAAVADLFTRFKEHDGDGARYEFDGVAAAAYHAKVHLDDSIVADDDFWRYLAVVDFHEIIEWRFGTEERTAHRDNYGLGDRWECYPRVLWLRAELSLDEGSEDPYQWAVRGGRDFWASGVIRRIYACSRPVARALVKFQFPEAGEYFGDRYRPQTLTLAGIRDLYKRLRHFTSIVSLPSLGDQEALALVRSLTEDLPRQPE